MQVFEQLFQAFEQRWPQSAEEQFKQQQWVDTSQFKCAGLKIAQNATRVILSLFSSGAHSCWTVCH